MIKQQTISIDKNRIWGHRMKEINYWNQFMHSEKVEDYLKFKNRAKEEKNPKGDMGSAGFYSRNRDDYQGSAYRGIR